MNGHAGGDDAAIAIMSLDADSGDSFRNVGNRQRQSGDHALPCDQDGMRVGGFRMVAIEVMSPARRVLVQRAVHASSMASGDRNASD